MSSSADSATNTIDEMDEDWEEWDGRSPFWAHCVAGSMAGVVEHSAIYPLDTVRTHIQVCAGCLPSSSSSSSIHNAKNKFLESSSTLLRTSAAGSSSSTSHYPPRLPLGMWQTIRHLVSEPAIAATVPSSSLTTTTTTVPPANYASNAVGFTRLFRGVQAVFIGCIPAHALYFSSYEVVKAAFTDETTQQVSTVGSSLAGAAAVTAHDLIMTPLDTLKQRLQLGHYTGVTQALRQVYQQEGVIALYRSFPITLLTNVPYGMVMVSTHEACKKVFREADVMNGDNNRRPAWQIVLAASSVAGLVASAVTTPLDRIKTALQTQQLAPVCGAVMGKQQQQKFCLLQQQSKLQLKHANWQQAAATIFKEEGAAGFVRGMTPRILSHTPAVAISWTTYETAKQYLLQHF